MLARRWQGTERVTPWVNAGMARTLGAAFLVAVLGACDQPAADLREWTVDDHDHKTESKKSRRLRSPAKHRKPSSRDQLVAVTWLKQCAECHGKKGRGDGPKGPMVKARDLTAPALQTMLTDDAIAQVIKNGRDKMPAFDLPESTIKGLVQLVRSFGERAKRSGLTRAAARRGGAAPKARVRSGASVVSAPASLAPKAAATSPGNPARGAAGP